MQYFCLGKKPVEGWRTTIKFEQPDTMEYRRYIDYIRYNGWSIDDIFSFLKNTPHIFFVYLALVWEMIAYIFYFNKTFCTYALLKIYITHTYACFKKDPFMMFNFNLFLIRFIWLIRKKIINIFNYICFFVNVFAFF